MRCVLAAIAIAASLLTSDATVAHQHQADEMPPFACLLTMAAGTPPPSVMELALSVDGIACGRGSTSEAVTIVAPSQVASCTQIPHSVRISARKAVAGLEAQELLQRCSPVVSATRSGEVIALSRRTTATHEYGDIANEITAYAGWSAVPARYFISGAVGDIAVFCFETDGYGDVPGYLEQAGLKDLDQFQIVRGTGTCRDVVQAKLNVDLPWRDGT